MFKVLQDIFRIEELRKRIFYTLSILFIFRIGAYIPLPGIDSQALNGFFEQQTAAGNVLNFFNTFSGGALTNLSIFALGVLPYISASIIVQLMTAVLPYFERLAKEGDVGRRKITQYTRLGTLFLSVIQGFGISAGIRRMSDPGGNPVLISSMDPLLFTVITVTTLTAGTCFVMWLGEQINEKGIGNGISLIIFAGIVSEIPDAVYGTYIQFVNNEIGAVTLLLVLMIIVGVIFAIIFIETAQRRIPVQYPRRTQGRNVVNSQSQHLPLKINSAGVIPAIFASSLLAFPVALTTFSDSPWVLNMVNELTPGQWGYNIIFVVLIFFFCFFYTALQFNPLKIADDLRRHGGFVPGVRPGQKTAEFLNNVLTRLTFGGAIYLSIVCVIPAILYNLMNVPFFFGGTALLIVIGVALDTSNQIEMQLINQNYEGFRRKKRKSYARGFGLK